MTFRPMQQRLKVLDYLKDCPRLGRVQVISQKIIKAAFKNDPCRKMTR